MGAFEDFMVLEMGRRSALLTKAITGYDADPNLGGAPAILQGSPLGTWFYEETSDKWWRKINATPTGWVDQTAAPGGGAFDRREETFIPTPAQTLFTLAATPVTANDTSVFVNTVKYIYGINFTVAANQVTWLPGVSFALDALDVMEIIYFV